MNKNTVIKKLSIILILLFYTFPGLLLSEESALSTEVEKFRIIYISEVSIVVLASYGAELTNRPEISYVVKDASGKTIPSEKFNKYIKAIYATRNDKDSPWIEHHSKKIIFDKKKGFYFKFETKDPTRPFYFNVLRGNEYEKNEKLNMELISDKYRSYLEPELGLTGEIQGNRAPYIGTLWVWGNGRSFKALNQVKKSWWKFW